MRHFGKWNGRRHRRQSAGEHGAWHHALHRQHRGTRGMRRHYSATGGKRQPPRRFLHHDHSIAPQHFRDDQPGILGYWIDCHAQWRCEFVGISGCFRKLRVHRLGGWRVHDHSKQGRSRLHAFKSSGDRERSRCPRSVLLCGSDPHLNRSYLHTRERRRPRTGFVYCYVEWARTHRGIPGYS